MKRLQWMNEMKTFSTNNTFTFVTIFSETSIVGFHLNLNEWQDLNEWMNEMNEMKESHKHYYTFNNIFSETSIIGFHLNVNEWQDLNEWMNEMNEGDFDVGRLPALRKAKPEAATGRHSQLDLEGNK